MGCQKMKSSFPWSVRGIDERTREAALEAARQALALQPSAQANQDLIALAEQKLREEGNQ